MQMLPISLPPAAVRIAAPRRRAASPALFRWMGAGIFISVLVVVYLCFYFGAFVGRAVTAPHGFLAPTRLRVSRALDPSFIRGYTAGILAGRKAANLAPTLLTPDEIELAVDRGVVPGVSSFGDGSAQAREFQRAFVAGARAGMAQRLGERFGQPPLQEQRALVVKGDILPIKAKTKKPARHEPRPDVGGGIKRVLRPDGRVEYTNL